VEAISPEQNSFVQKISGSSWIRQWLPYQRIGEVLKSPPEHFLDCYPISRQINSVKFDEPEHAKEIALDFTGLLQSESSNHE
jgi:hypothetical protein